jgi:hypothetical protein
MFKKLWRSFVGSVKWVFWMLTMCLVLNVMLVCALLVTPALFFFFWKAQSTAEVFEEIIDKVATRFAEEMEKADKFNIYNDVEFEMEIDDEEDNVF